MFKNIYHACNIQKGLKQAKLWEVFGFCHENPVLNTTISQFQQNGNSSNFPGFVKFILKKGYALVFVYFFQFNHSNQEWNVWYFEYLNCWNIFVKCNFSLDILAKFLPNIFLSFFIDFIVKALACSSKIRCFQFCPVRASCLEHTLPIKKLMHNVC